MFTNHTSSNVDNRASFDHKMVTAHQSVQQLVNFMRWKLPKLLQSDFDNVIIGQLPGARYIRRFDAGFGTLQIALQEGKSFTGLFNMACVSGFHVGGRFRLAHNQSVNLGLDADDLVPKIYGNLSLLFAVAVVAGWRFQFRPFLAQILLEKVINLHLGHVIP